MFHLMFLCYFNNNIWQHGHPWKTNPGIEWVYRVWHHWNQTVPITRLALVAGWHFTMAVVGFNCSLFPRKLVVSWLIRPSSSRPQQNKFRGRFENGPARAQTCSSCHARSFPIVFKIWLIAVMLLNTLTQHSAFWQIHFCQSECWMFYFHLF